MGVEISQILNWIVLFFVYPVFPVQYMHEMIDLKKWYIRDAECCHLNFKWTSMHIEILNVIMRFIEEEELSIVLLGPEWFEIIDATLDLD